MVKNSSVEEDYQDVVEAAAQVFINSFLAMDNPVRQTRIEAKELNRQWKNLIQGREEIGLEGDDDYLDEASINRQRLSVGTAIRLDLALFCRFTYSPTLEMERIQRVVEDFALLFLSKRDFRVNDNQSPLRETYTQLVAILLAVYTRQTRSAFKRITIADIRDAIKADIVYGPVSLPELRIDEAVQLAQYVANDTKRLDSLYNNTLKKIIERMRTKDKAIPRPADKEALLVLQAKHDDIVKAIYRKEPKDKSVDEYRDEIWLQEERAQDNVAARQLQQEISDEWDTMIAEEEDEEGGHMRQSSRPSASQRRKLREEKTQDKASTREPHQEVSEEWDTEIEEEPLKRQSSRASTAQNKTKNLPEVGARRHEVREMSDIDMDMEVSFEKQPSKANAIKKKDLPEKKVRRRELKVGSDSEMEESFERKPSKASTSQKRSKQQQQQQRQPAHNDDDMDIDDHRPPATLLLSQQSTKAGTSGSRQVAVRESRRIPVIQATKPRTKKNMEPESRERHKDVPDSDRSDFEVEKQEEVEEDEEDEPVRKKKRKDNKEAKFKRRQRTNGSPSFSNSADEDDGNNGSNSAEDSDPGMRANGRRRSRKWTLKEVQVLMELVPMFQYDESEVKVRKRTIKWAALKRYDMDNGYVLRHRSQVMLKDKYREQTDQGKHRQHVRALRLAREAMKKQATKEAEGAGAKKAAKGRITRDPELSEDVYEEDDYEEDDNENA
ncbi:hypothetical protein EC957_001144 [Mortierella hygrophila]|uniref:Uncharacterized protein n=1 Tax=Mortierella hygrophila TaxID=979708 RepID=A0A9P6K7S2_9FUNG|nr:hypothetical protein EC957_001144 [Mortierella hygrophila]